MHCKPWPGKVKLNCHCCSGKCRKSGSYRNRNRIVQRFFCERCGKSFSEQQPLDGLRVDFDKACQVVHMLCESMGIRAIQRLTGLHQETILNLVEAAGQKAEQFLDEKLRNLKVDFVQADEIASYVFCHQYKSKGEPGKGGFYTFLSIDRDSKLIINHLTDRRNGDVAKDFMRDLRSRITNRFHLCTDGWRGYSQKRGAVRTAFGDDIDYATEIKQFYSKNQNPARMRFRYEMFGTTRLDSVVKKARIGQPDMDASTTSHCERTNLTFRQLTKRFHRFTLGYSKKLSNHKHAIALFIWYFNFVKKHAAHRTTPAEAVGVTDKPMTVAELLQSTI